MQAAFQLSAESGTILEYTPALEVRVHVRTIVVPVDLSPCAVGVVQRGIDMATAFGSTLELVNVVSPPAGLSPDSLIRPPGAQPISIANHLRNEARVGLDRYATMARQAGIDTATHVEIGDVAAEILRLVERLDAGLIVMGTHGRTGVARMMLGSVAGKVLRSATCPVLTVRSIHHEGCQAAACNWCSAHVGPAQQDAEAEQSG